MAVEEAGGVLRLKVQEAMAEEVTTPVVAGGPEVVARVPLELPVTVLPTQVVAGVVVIMALVVQGVLEL